MKRVIRLGDPHSHGGTVMRVADNRSAILGQPLARVGDLCSCPIPGHQGCVIVQGDPLWTIDGIPVALDGHVTSCGASLISTLPSLSRS